MEEAGILLWGADADADPGWELVAGHGAGDDTEVLEGLEDGLAVADVDEDEVSGGGDEFEMELAEAVLEEVEAGVVVLAGGEEVVGVVEGGEGSDLGQRVDVEGFADFFEGSDEVGAADGVAEAEAGEAIDLGEGAKEDEVGSEVIANEGDEVEGVWEEVDVGFVHDEEDVIGDLVCEIEDVLVWGEGAGGVIGVGDEDDAGLRGDGLEHGWEVMAVVEGGDGNEASTEEVGDDGVDGEAVLRDDGIGVGVEEGVADEFEELIGAVAEEEVGGLDAEVAGEALLEVEGVAVGVEVDVGDGGVEGGDGFRGGAEGVFVGGEFDDLVEGQAEFAGDLVDGAAGLVDGEVGEGGEEGEGRGHGVRAG